MTRHTDRRPPAKGNSDRLSAHELDAVKRRLDEDLFSCCFSDTCPHLLIVSGLPGSGKSTVFEIAAHNMVNFLTVSDDMLRRYHPRFEQHMCDDPVDGIRRSDEMLREVRAYVIEQATIRHVNVLMETDPMPPQDFMDCFGSFIKAGHPLRLLLVAEPEIVCRQNLAWRFEAAARNEARPDLHSPRADLGDLRQLLVEMADFVEREGLARRLVVIDQDEHLLFLHDADRHRGVGDYGVAQALDRQMGRHLSGAEQDRAIEMWERIAHMMRERGADADEVKTVQAVKNHMRQIRKFTE